MIKNFISVLIFSVLILGDAFAQFPKDSLEILLENEHDVAKKLVYYRSLSIKYLNSDYGKSLNYSYDGLELARQNNQAAFILDLSVNLGIVFFQSGVYDLALKYFFQGKEMASKTNNKRAFFIIKNNIGGVYDRTLQYDKALDEYLEIEKEFVTLGDTAMFKGFLSSLYNNIGNIYDMKQEHNLAFAYYYKSLYISQSDNDQNLGIVLKNLGDLFLEENVLDSSEFYFAKSLEIRRNQNKLNEICSSLLAYSNLYIVRRQFGKANLAATEALEIAQKLHSIYDIQQSYSVLSGIYEEQQNMDKAFEYYKVYKQYSDSIFNERVAGELTSLEMEHNINLKEKEVLEKQKAREMKLFALVFLLVVLVAFVLLLYFLMKSSMKAEKLQKQNLHLEKKALEADLEIKNKELITNVMYLVKKNELIKETSDRLMETLPKISPENKKSIQNVILDLQSSVNNDVWQDFELRFNEVHSEFYEKLSKNFKELTPNEIRLCAFLKLNMTTKEISAITQQSARSIEVARVRLRKKLNLTNTSINLVSFFNEL